jgi:uncharacterized protein YjiS (DUF1127 family)
MLIDEETDLSALNFQELSPKDWDQLRRCAIARAHRTRSQVIKALAGQLFMAMRGSLATVAKAGVAPLARWYDGMLARHADRSAIARLQSLDDGALRDIGIRRTEIESIVHARGNDDTRSRRDHHLAA